MSRRNFIPESPGRLEGRALLSGGTRLPGGPVSISGLGVDLTLARIRADFEEFAIGRKLPLLKHELHSILGGVPFNRASGLGQTVAGILGQMESDLQAGAPHAVATAEQAVISTIQAGGRADLAAGRIVIR